VSKFESLSDRKEDQVYERTKKKHKLVRVGSSVAVISAVVICVLLGIRLYYYRDFNAYKVVKTVERKDGGASNYKTLGTGLYKYSRDGVVGYDEDLNIKWSGSYNFTAPIEDSCGKFVAVAHAGGKEIYVFDGSDSGVKIDVLHPITHIQVAGQGVVAVVMENGDSDITQLIDSQNENEILVEYMTTVAEDGFPVDIALSNDGKKLVTSYLYIENGVSQSKLSFYNFGDVGQNYVKKIVKAMVFDQELVSGVEFLGNNTVCAFNSTGYNLFSMKQLVEDKKQEKFDKEINSVIVNDNYYGFVMNEQSGDSEYRLHLYDNQGNLKLNKKIDFPYDTVYMINKELFFMSEREIYIMNLNGSLKMDCQSDSELVYMMPTSRFDKYLLVDSKNISKVKLIEED